MQRRWTGEDWAAFAKAWNAADKVSQVAARFKMTVLQASRQAGRARARGLKLKYFVAKRDQQAVA